jgi:hypothetical protein
MPNLEDQNAVEGWILDEVVGPNARIQQGDIVRFDNSQYALQHVGIIVTADCDIEQKKHARRVTLIPVLTAAAILENYLLIEDCEKKRPQIEDFLFRSAVIDKKQDRDTKLSLLRSHFNCGFGRHDEMLNAALSFLFNESESISINLYRKLMSEIGSSPKKQDALCDQIRNRGDLLVLPDTARLGVSGNIAWVRHIWQIPLGDIAIRSSELRSRQGERIARLDSPYRYRLTQKMGQVFSDIGLPNSPDNIAVAVRGVYEDA